MDKTHDLHVVEFNPLSAPEQIILEYPMSEAAFKTVTQGRQGLRQAMLGLDRRWVVIVGPCSIHEESAAYDYAEKLVRLKKRFSDKMQIVMRVYFEKPRTTIGWKGLINDPRLNGSNDIEQGLRLARKILLKINEMGLSAATEFLDPIVPQYIADLVSWAAIGARTTESQTHRQMASGLSMPVGFKNATDGGLQVALDAMIAARSPHVFVGIDGRGQTAIVKTTGNPDVHVVLRGGGGKTNFSPSDISKVKASLSTNEDKRLILVDCSHGNSAKDFRNQPGVFQNVLAQFLGGEKALLGAMIESHLIEGRQDPSKESLVYGQSITDACLGWDATENLLEKAYSAI